MRGLPLKDLGSDARVYVTIVVRLDPGILSGPNTTAAGRSSPGNCDGRQGSAHSDHDRDAVMVSGTLVATGLNIAAIASFPIGSSLSYPWPISRDHRAISSCRGAALHDPDHDPDRRTNPDAFHSTLPAGLEAANSRRGSHCDLRRRHRQSRGLGSALCHPISRCRAISSSDALKASHSRHAGGAQRLAEHLNMPNANTLEALCRYRPKPTPRRSR